MTVAQHGDQFFTDSRSGNRALLTDLARSIEPFAFSVLSGFYRVAR